MLNILPKIVILNKAGLLYLLKSRGSVFREKSVAESNWTAFGIAEGELLLVLDFGGDYRGAGFALRQFVCLIFVLLLFLQLHAFLLASWNLKFITLFTKTHHLSLSKCT
jgi:hypothetical protein